MPWRESSVMEERLRFVARLLEGEAMTRCVPGVRHIAQDRLQDLRPLQGARAGGPDRPLAAAGALRQPAAAARSRALIVRLKREKPHWGARKIRELLVRRLAGDVRVPAKSTVHAVLDRHGLVKRSGGPRHRAQRHAAVGRRQPQRSVVRRLQGRVQARQWPLLLPADRHRPGLALPAAVRSAGIDPRRPCLHGLRAAVPRARPARRHPLRQRRALRQPQRPLQSLQALGLVAPARHRDRAHQARPSAAERPPRAHAPAP